MTAGTDTPSIEEYLLRNSFTLGVRLPGDMVLYRKSAQLALQATLLLAMNPKGAIHRVRDLAEELGIAPTYLAKVLQNLTRVGLVRAVRGPGGGVQLAQDPDKVFLWDVLSAVEPVGSLEQCFLGLSLCNASRPCPMHETWAPLRNHFLEVLHTRSLSEFAREAKCCGLFLEKVNSATGQGQAAGNTNKVREH